MFLSEDLDPEELKNEANLKWKNGEIEDANNLWRQALKECIKYSMRGYPTTKNRDMQISLRLNLSLYHFKKNELSECINQCNIILENLMNLNDVLNYYENNKNIEKEINEINKINEEKKDDTISENKFIKKDTLIKIFLRRANSFLCLQDFDKCRENIELIKRLDNKNVEMIALEKKMKIEEVDYNKKQKELYKKMCNTIKKKEKE
ncbi:conserved Plasmodium protein, unknown function [Plasmodium gallinaceum]|uniref:Tetratricopeptide repeat protein n=1 Tax=Plasmodium gallinaceum TaxID=5849 RepID=A0A1J1GLA3_PLAGA|nr:conserved Plasmodium protein, unknown function [Plasmodium gallinaceum]CRG93137.1 conserved Plasmodium protein, unknown function [Plasmodium gallinaceum]